MRLLLAILLLMCGRAPASEIVPNSADQCVSFMTFHELDQWIFERELQLRKAYGFTIVVAPAAIYKKPQETIESLDRLEKLLSEDALDGLSLKTLIMHLDFRDIGSKGEIWLSVAASEPEMRAFLFRQRQLDPLEGSQQKVEQLRTRLDEMMDRTGLYLQVDGSASLDQQEQQVQMLEQLVGLKALDQTSLTAVSIRKAPFAPHIHRSRMLLVSDDFSVEQMLSLLASCPEKDDPKVKRYQSLRDAIQKRVLQIERLNSNILLDIRASETTDEQLRLLNMLEVLHADGILLSVEYRAIGFRDCFRVLPSGLWIDKNAGVERIKEFLRKNREPRKVEVRLPNPSPLDETHRFSGT